MIYFWRNNLTRIDNWLAGKEPTAIALTYQEMKEYESHRVYPVKLTTETIFYDITDNTKYVNYKHFKLTYEPYNGYQTKTINNFVTFCSLPYNIPKYVFFIILNFFVVGAQILWRSHIFIPYFCANHLTMLDNWLAGETTNQKTPSAPEVPEAKEIKRKDEIYDLIKENYV